MHTHTVFTLCVVYLGYVAFGIGESTPVAGLTAHFSIEGRFVEHNLVVFTFFLLNLTVAQYFCRAFEAVITDKFGVSFIYNHPVGGLNSGGIACAGFLRFHLTIELSVVESHAVFFQNKFGKVERKSVCVVQHKRFFAGNFVFACRFCRSN